VAKKVKPESLAFLVALSVVGILLTVAGALFDSHQVFWITVFTSLGAAIIGTAFSLLMARVFEPSPMNEIYQLLSIDRHSPLVIHDEKVRPRRIKYHGYLLSHAFGKPQWKYRIFDFSRDPRPGYLHAKVDVWVPREDAAPPQAGAGHRKVGGEEPHDPHQKYFYDGFLCDPYHLLLVGRLDPELGAEPDVIHVFPFALKDQLGVMAGLAFLETSDDKHVVTPTILSKERQTSETEFGPVVDPLEQAKLLKLWRKHFQAEVTDNVSSAH
jgi:hypothetical protein